MLSERRRQEEPRVGHQAIVVEDCVEAVEAVRRSHQSGVLLVGSWQLDHRHLPNSEGHLFTCPDSRISPGHRWIRAKPSRKAGRIQGVDATMAASIAAGVWYSSVPGARGEDTTSQAGETHVRCSDASRTALRQGVGAVIHGGVRQDAVDGSRAFRRGQRCEDRDHRRQWRRCDPLSGKIANLDQLAALIQSTLAARPGPAREYARSMHGLVRRRLAPGARRATHIRIDVRRSSP